MANIQEKLNNIKNALFGRDVRDSIHDGIDAINKEVENTTSRQVDLESTFDQLVINAGNSNAEIVDARVQADGTSYTKLGDRLNKFDAQFNTIENKVNEIYDENILNMYVSPAGSDVSGDGTEENPYQTIDKAINEIPVLNKFDIIINLESGVYSSVNSVDEWGRPISYSLVGKNYNARRDINNLDMNNKYGKLIIKGKGENTVLDGNNKSSRVGIYAHSVGDIVIRDIKFIGYHSAIASHEFGNVTINNCVFDECTNAILVENQSKVEVSSSIFNDNENDIYSKNGQIQIDNTIHNGSKCVINTEGSPYHWIGKITCNNVVRFMQCKGDGYIIATDSKFVGDGSNDFFEGSCNYLYINRCKISKFNTVYDCSGGRIETVSSSIFDNGFVVYNTKGNAEMIFSTCDSNNEDGIEVSNTQSTPFRISCNGSIHFVGSSNNIKPYKVLYSIPEDAPIIYKTAPPVSGYHFKGKLCINTSAASGNPMGWICTAAGIPGTWSALPNIL